MTTGFEKIAARRAWFVPHFVVWGLPVREEMEFLVLEKIATDEAVYFGCLDIGDTSQQVVFSDLTDHRGNQLPATISSPRVVIRPRSRETAFIVSQESPADFKIARDPEASGPVMVDLMIVEMGD